MVYTYFFVFSSQHVFTCFSFLCPFACGRNNFSSISSLVSFPGFEFMFGFLRGTQILLLTSFTQALISSFFFSNVDYWDIDIILFTFSVTIFSSLRAFHDSVWCYSFTEAFVRASLFRSPGLFSVIWPISATCKYLSFCFLLALPFDLLQGQHPIDCKFSFFIFFVD